MAQVIPLADPRWEGEGGFLCDAISQLVCFALEMLQCISLPTRTSRTSPPSKFYAYLRFPDILVNSGVTRGSQEGGPGEAQRCSGRHRTMVAYISALPQISNGGTLGGGARVSYEGHVPPSLSSYATAAKPLY